MADVDGSDIEHLWQTVWRLGFYRGGPVLMSAISGIDIALWDMKGILQPFHSNSSDTLDRTFALQAMYSVASDVSFCSFAA